MDGWSEEWIEGLKDREVKILNTGYFGEKIHFGFITGSFFFFHAL